MPDELLRFGFSASLLEKRAALIELGVDPYPHSPMQPSAIAEARKASSIAEDVVQCVVAGRLWSRREMGGSIFLDLKDSSGKIQLYLRKNDISQDQLNCLRLYDLGDWLGVAGTTFTTQAGELTIAVTELKMLGKAIVPIPVGKERGAESFHRLADERTKYGNRYLHWALHEGDRQRMYTRSRIISQLRRSMEDNGFLEVTTPTIENTYGGAEARPFQTEVWALGRKKAYLRISPELYMKRYIVAGFDRVFTICQNFRNEGIDRSHNPEFTMMEWYETFSDYRIQMERFERLVSSICQATHGCTRIQYQGRDLDFTPPWPRLRVVDAVNEKTGLDVERMSIDELRTELRNRALPVASAWGKCVINLFEELCEASLWNPVFIIDHPREISPLAKQHRENDRYAERFEPYAAGMEIGNSYTELADPVEQARCFLAQVNNAEDQDYEDHPLDEDFIFALGCGMPPTGGVGLGVDRLIMLLTDSPSIRDIVPFPMMRNSG